MRCCRTWKMEGGIGSVHCILYVSRCSSDLRLRRTASPHRLCPTAAALLRLAAALSVWKQARGSCLSVPGRDHRQPTQACIGRKFNRDVGAAPPPVSNAAPHTCGCCQVKEGPECPGRLATTRPSTRLLNAVLDAATVARRAAVCMHATLPSPDLQMPADTPCLSAAQAQVTRVLVSA